MKTKEVKFYLSPNEYEELKIIAKEKADMPVSAFVREVIKKSIFEYYVAENEIIFPNKNDLTYAWLFPKQP